MLITSGISIPRSAIILSTSLLDGILGAFGFGVVSTRVGRGLLDTGGLPLGSITGGLGGLGRMFPISGKLIFSKLISSPKALGVEILLGLRLDLALGFILAFGLTAAFVFFLGVTLILRPLGRGALSMISSILIISIPGMLILINFNNLHRENGHKSEV